MLYSWSVLYPHEFNLVIRRLRLRRPNTFERSFGKISSIMFARSFFMPLHFISKKCESPCFLSCNTNSIIYSLATSWTFKKLTWNKTRYSRVDYKLLKFIMGYHQHHTTGLFLYLLKPPLHKKWHFLLTISSVSVAESAVSCRNSHIYWKNL